VPFTVSREAWRPAPAKSRGRYALLEHGRLYNENRRGAPSAGAGGRRAEGCSATTAR